MIQYHQKYLEDGKNVKLDYYDEVSNLILNHIMLKLNEDKRRNILPCFILEATTTLHHLSCLN